MAEPEALYVITEWPPETTRDYPMFGWRCLQPGCGAFVAPWGRNRGWAGVAARDHQRGAHGVEVRDANPGGPSREP